MSTAAPLAPLAPAPRAKKVGGPILTRTGMAPARLTGRARACGLLREAREAAGWSRTQLGRRLGVSESMVASWERETSRDAITVGDLLAAPAVAAHFVRLLEVDARPAAGVDTRQHLALVMAEVGDVGRVIATNEALDVLERELAEAEAAIEAMRRDVRALRGRGA